MHYEKIECIITKTSHVVSFVAFLFRSTMWNILVLCPILGITWVFGVLSVNQELVAFQYIFAVANSLQVSGPLPTYLKMIAPGEYRPTYIPD